MNTWGVSLRQLRLFVAAARHPSLAAASRRLNVSQATLSEAIRDLEGVLGRRLFDRDGRRLRLNALGHGFLVDAEHLVMEADDLVRRHGVKRQLTIGASVTIGNYILSDVLIALRRLQPELGISVVIRNTETIAKAVAAREVDVALVEGAIRNSDLEVRPWRNDALVVIAAQGHPVARGATVKDLMKADWILREVGSGTRESFDSVTRDWPQPARVAMTVGGNELLKALVRDGAGLGCLSAAAVVDEARRGELSIVPTGPFVMGRILRIVTPMGRRPDDAVSAFLSVCEQSRDITPPA